MNCVAYLTTAPMGGYKSYSRGVSYVMDEFLPQQDGTLYTTIPLNLDEIVIEALKIGIDEETVRRRINVIDAETVNSWTNDGSISGPWDMDVEKLKGAHLQFDEFHHYCPKTGEVERRRLWREWIAEIRHEHATIEFLTQDLDSIDDLLVKKIALRKELVNQETARDPYFKIPMGDWYELKGKICGFWSPCVWEIEYRKANRRWVETGYQRKIYPKARYYELYDSFSKPHRRQREESASSETTETLEVENPAKNLKLKQFQKRNSVSLILWFLKRNFFTLSLRLSFLFTVFWICFFGGGQKLLGAGMSYFENIPNKISNVEKIADSNLSEIIIEKDVQEIILSTNFSEGNIIDYTLADLRKLILDYQVLLLELDLLDDEIAVLKQTAPTLQMIGSDYVVFSTGRIYYQDDKLLESGYYGKKITNISRKNNSVRLDDGTSIFINKLQIDQSRRSSIIKPKL
tara:strand:+ start:1513 stop:2892 length:1380 start_codon:yes stop_codon:yes gene_type:complete